MKTSLLRNYVFSFLFLLSFVNTYAVTKTVGSGGDYTKLELAFTAINNGTLTGEVTLQIISNITETSSASLNASLSGSANYSKVLIYPTSAGLTISSATLGANSIIKLNGADKVTIDGRVNATGTTPSLTISNTSNTDPRVIEFINAAQDNNVQYLKMKGASTSATLGIINFSTTNTTVGNSGNTISYCDISGIDNTNRPINAIYSAGTGGKENLQNTIRSNNIFNFLRPSADSFGINLGSNSSEFTIRSNSFYEDVAAFVPTSAANYIIINIDYSSGKFHNISDNYIGGRAPLCGSSSAKWTKTNANTNNFTAIYINSSSNASSINGNTISNFDFNNLGAGNWTGISVSGGIVTVGSTKGNIIGARTGTASIKLTNGATNGAFYGINAPSSKPVEIYNNSIGSIQTDAAAGCGTHIYGIYKISGSSEIYVRNNIIGSETTANSLYAASANAGTVNRQEIIGIFISLNSVNTSVSGNTICNLYNDASGAASTSATHFTGVRGIEVTGALIDSIINNKIFKLKTASKTAGDNGHATIIGIRSNTTSGNEMNHVNITDNTIYELETTATGVTSKIIGIFSTLGSLGSENDVDLIARNYIHTFRTAGTSSSEIRGIRVWSGRMTVTNNVIKLGQEISTQCQIIGIFNDGWNIEGQLPSRFYHNTVHISGSGGGSSYAFYHGLGTTLAPNLQVINNILWNARGGSGTHYAIRIKQSTNMTIDHNIYNYTGSLGYINGVAKTDYAAWQATITSDQNSSIIAPEFYNILTPTLSSDFQLTSNRTGGVITPSTLVTTDMAQLTRSSTNPTIGAWEYFGSPVEVWDTALKGSYTTIKAAFDDINSHASTWTGNLSVILKGNTEEVSTATLNGHGSGEGIHRTIKVYPARTGVVISGSISNAPLIDINGADSVTINGTVNNIGTEKDMIISNNSTSALANTSTVRLINDANCCTLKGCTLKGSSTNASTGIVFVSSGVTIGNDNDSIYNNNITNAGGRPFNGIYSNGSGIDNNNLRIVNNNIFNVFGATGNNVGIHLAANTSLAEVSGNSIYDTASIAPTADGVNYLPIYINNTSGGDFTVQNNYIGGREPFCAGSAMRKDPINIYSTGFEAIRMNVGTATTSNVYSNKIKNISWRNTDNSAGFAGIYVEGGSVNVGAENYGNTIGGTTGTDSILITHSANGGIVSLIDVRNSSGTVNVDYNTIGAITATNSVATQATHLYGIYKNGSAGTINIRNNQIGSLTEANGFRSSSASTANAQFVNGIYNAGIGTASINDNVIINLINNTTNSTPTTAGYLRGIASAAGTTVDILRNTIKKLSTANANNSIDINSSIVGIALTGNSSDTKISENTIDSLTNTFSTSPYFTGRVTGIYYGGPTSGANNVEKNFVYGLSTHATATSESALVGIQAESGVTTYANNIIYLGNDTPNTVYGIYDTGIGGTNSCNLFFNTIYLKGNTTAEISAAIYSASTNTRNYKNNILFNARSKSGATGSHYAIYYNSSNTNLSSDYNDYYTPNTGGILGYYGGDIASNPIVPSNDANSINQDPVFGTSWTIASNYSAGVSLSGVSGTGIINDYSFSPRGNNPTIGAWERNVNQWEGTNSTSWSDAGNWSGGVTPTSNDNIEFSPTATRDCYMTGNFTLNRLINASGRQLVVGANSLTITGSITLSNGSTINASAPSAEVVFAGSTTQNIAQGVFTNDEVFNLKISNNQNLILQGTLRLLNSITKTTGVLDATTELPKIIYAGLSTQYIEPNILLGESIHDVEINNTDVQLNADITIVNSLLINSEKKLYIRANKKLNVLGIITNNNGVNGLHIKADATNPNGTLIFNNSTSQPVSATVEMYAKGDYNLSRGAYPWTWQFFGIPLQSVAANPALTGSYVRAHNEAGTTSALSWVSLNTYSTLTSFNGYEITQTAKKIITFQGVLDNRNQIRTLAYTTGSYNIGEHILGNPYTAAISIPLITFGSQTQSTIYLYNTGSYSDWASQTANTNSSIVPGRYNAAPKWVAGLGGIPGEIPSMQGFLVKALSASANATISIPYNSVARKNSIPQRSKSPNKAPMDVLTITVIELTSPNYYDKMWIFTEPTTTRSFDDGWDGTKILTSGEMTQLFASEADGDYQVDALPDINQTYLGFQSGSDTTFTMKFTHENINPRYSELYLIDLLENKITDIMTTGTTYSFTALQNTSPVNRFKIVTTPELISNIRNKKDDANEIRIFSNETKIFVQNKTAQNGQLNVFDMTGKIVFSTLISAENSQYFNTNLPSGSYIAKLKTNSNQLTQPIILK